MKVALKGKYYRNIITILEMFLEYKKSQKKKFNSFKILKDITNWLSTIL